MTAMTNPNLELMEAKVRDLRDLYALRGQYLAAVVTRMLLEEILGELRYLKSLERSKMMESQVAMKHIEISRSLSMVFHLRENVKSYQVEFQAVKDVLDLSKEEVEEYGGIKGLSERVKGLQRANSAARAENEKVAKRLRTDIAEVRKAKNTLRKERELEKREKAKRMKLERLCRELASEVSTMRKEVRAMKAAWKALRGDVDGLKGQVDRGETVVWTTLHELIKTGVLTDELPGNWTLETTVREKLAAHGIGAARETRPKRSPGAVT